MAGAEKLVKRNDKIAFMNVGTKETPDFQRMRRFTEINTSKNPTEYSRHYVDEETETTDVVGYSEEKSFAFDQYANNVVHEKLVDIIDNEKTGDEATVEILVVNKSNVNSDGTYEARKRTYAVVPDSDGDATEAYTYSGSFKAKSALEVVKVNLSDDMKTATISVGV